MHLAIRNPFIPSQREKVPRVNSDKGKNIQGLLMAMEADLLEHIEVCRAVYHVVEREARALHSPGQSSEFAHTNNTRKKLLPLLDRSIEKIRLHRSIWEKIPARHREKQVRIKTLLTQGQDMIMKIISLDRDNENSLLKRGAIPARQIPSSKRQQPAYVAGLYQQFSKTEVGHQNRAAQLPDSQ